MLRKLALTIVATLAFAACGDNGITAPQSAPDAVEASLFNNFTHGRDGAVYVLSNSAAGNEVLIYERNSDGSLDDPAAVATGGTGSGAGLGTQGAVILSRNGRWLVAVNAGSDNISLFRVTHNGLQLTDVVPSGGEMPISVATHGPFVYALNGGGVNNISGFWITWWGKLVDIPGSAQPLSANSPGPAQVEFSPDGDHLVVTEKGTNLILTYKVNRFGRSSAPETHTSSGMTPFGFAFAGRHTLIVSEAFGGAPDASAASSYRFRHSGLDVITGSAGTTETAACWTVVTRNGRFAYVTNTGSGTVSGYRIGSHGQLTLLDGDGVTGVTGVGSAPADAAMDSNSRFLYTRNGGDQTISIFRISPDGSLTPLPGVTGLPATAVGLAAN